MIRAARELGSRRCRSTARPTPTSLAVQLADEAVEIGPPQATKSYLKVEAILEAAKATGPRPSIRATASWPRTPASPMRSRRPG
jgi:acetyl/propionyl-CoA carboxylase alpha subunit